MCWHKLSQTVLIISKIKQQFIITKTESGVVLPLAGGVPVTVNHQLNAFSTFCSPFLNDNRLSKPAHLLRLRRIFCVRSPVTPESK